MIIEASRRSSGWLYFCVFTHEKRKNVKRVLAICWKTSSMLMPMISWKINYMHNFVRCTIVFLVVIIRVVDRQFDVIRKTSVNLLDLTCMMRVSRSHTDSECNVHGLGKEPEFLEPQNAVLKWNCSSKRHAHKWRDERAMHIFIKHFQKKLLEIYLII